MLYGTGKIEPLFKNNAATLLPEPAHRPRNDLLSYQPLYRAAALDWHIRSTHKIALRKDAVTVTPPWYRKFFSLFIVILAFAAVWSMGVFSVESTWVARGIAGTGFDSAPVLSLGQLGEPPADSTRSTIDRLTYE